MNQLPLAFTYGLCVLCINKIKKLLFQVFIFKTDYNSVVERINELNVSIFEDHILFIFMKKTGPGKQGEIIEKSR